MKPWFLLVAAAMAALTACNDATPPPATAAVVKITPKKAAPYPLLPGHRYTTLEKVWIPTEAPAKTKSAVLEGLIYIDDLPLYAAYGLDALAHGPGEPHVMHAELVTAPALGTRRSLLYFLQFSDVHIVDEESPVRLEGVTRIAYASAYRAQDHLTTQILDSLMQTVNAFSFADRPFDFAFTTGDIADTGQQNEVYWVRQLFDGDTVYPDSGQIDDPVPGSGNDFTDPFVAAGLDKRVPWYMLFGNHDNMHLGSFDPTPEVKRAAVGDRIIDLWNLDAFTDGQMTFGARDAARPYAPVVREGTHVAPDPYRKLITPPEFMAMFVTSESKPKGHGFTAAAVKSGETNYVARPVPGFPLVMLSLDTVMEMQLDAQGKVVQHAGSEGEISKAMLDGFIVPALQAAQDDGQLIIVTSHHCSESLQDGVSEVKRTEFRAVLKSFPNVIAHLCGHGHRSRAWFWAAGPGEAHGYPELMQASAVDFPIDARILELVDNGNGTLSLFTTQVEPNVEPGNLAYEALMYTAAAHNFPLASLLPPFRWYEDKPFRNMEVVIPVPPGVNVAALAAKTQVESLTRLADGVD